MRKNALSRRTVLRGMFGGTAVALALPVLEAMLGANGDVFADGTELPRRLGLWFWGDGVRLDQWTPDDTDNWTAKSILQPLADDRVEPLGCEAGRDRSGDRALLVHVEADMSGAATAADAHEDRVEGGRGAGE